MEAVLLWIKLSKNLKQKNEIQPHKHMYSNFLITKRGRPIFRHTIQIDMYSWSWKSGVRTKSSCKQKTMRVVKTWPLVA